MEISFEALLQKFIHNELNADELVSFLQMAEKQSHREKIIKAIEEKLQKGTHTAVNENVDMDQMFELMLTKAETYEKQESGQITLNPPGRYTYFTRIAATILILVAAGISFWLLDNKKTRATEDEHYTSTPGGIVLPGGDKAILRLADGSEIILDGTSNGELAVEGNASIVKLSNGQIAYKLKAGNGSPAIHNTMITPKGGQYQLLLSDGTKVWLNAASSLTYPIIFSGKERNVELKGEAYFEVAHNSKQTFRVKVNEMEINVLGTHFNVNAYEDESRIKTTLLEGSVSIQNGSVRSLLKPGQQAQVDKEGKLKLVDVPDPEETIAWKNGLFSFKDADLAAIMRQMSRWYDLEVHYEDKIPQRRFSGQVFRNLTLNEALKVLELSDIHFKIEGKKVTVMP